MGMDLHEGPYGLPKLVLGVSSSVVGLVLVGTSISSLVVCVRLYLDVLDGS